MPHRRHAQRAAMRPGQAPARSGPAGWRADRGALPRRAGDGAQQAVRPRADAGRRPRAERDRRGAPGAAAPGATKQPARSGLHRPARHRPLGTAAMRRRVQAADHRGAGPRRPGAAPGTVPRAAGPAALWRHALLHHHDCHAGHGGRARAAWRAAVEPDRRLLRHAGGARVPAPVPGQGAAHGDRRRGAAGHGAAGQLLDRRPGRAGGQPAGL